MLRDFLPNDRRRALREVMDAPLPAADRRAIEGEGTDDTGIWIGLPEDRDPGH